MKYDKLLEILKKRRPDELVNLANAILQGIVWEKISRGRPARQWLEDVKEWTGLSLNEMWREPYDRVAQRKRVSHVAPKWIE